MQVRLGILLLSCSLMWQVSSTYISFNEDNPGKYAYRKRVAAAGQQAMNRPWHDKTSENNGDEGIGEEEQAEERVDQIDKQKPI